MALNDQNWPRSFRQFFLNLKDLLAHITRQWPIAMIAGGVLLTALWVGALIWALSDLLDWISR